MLNLTILNSRQIKEVQGIIREQWGAPFATELVFLMSGKSKLYLVTRQVFDLEFKKLKVNSLGLYFGELKDGEFRLSIEGSQLIGPLATKNVIEVTDAEAMHWFKGEDIMPASGAQDCFCGFVILQHGSDFIGTGRYKNGLVKNFVQKARRFTYDLEVPQ